MAKIQIKSEKLTPFGGFFSIMEQFDALLAQTIDSTLGLRCTLFGYQYSEILRSLMCVYLCGLKSGQEYDFDFDHQFIKTEKYDAKPTYKKFLGYSPGTSHALQAVPRGPRDGELVNKRRATVAHVMVNECPNG